MLHVNILNDKANYATDLDIGLLAVQPCESTPLSTWTPFRRVFQDLHLAVYSPYTADCIVLAARPVLDAVRAILIVYGCFVAVHIPLYSILQISALAEALMFSMFGSDLSGVHPDSA